MDTTKIPNIKRSPSVQRSRITPKVFFGFIATSFILMVGTYCSGTDFRDVMHTIIRNARSTSHQVETLHFSSVQGTLYAKPQELPQNASRKTRKKIKKILFWNNFFGRTDFHFGFGRQPFIENGCDVTKCETTKNRADLNNSHAVIIHMNGEHELPGNRVPWQRWVFYLLEPPPNFKEELSKYNNLFNLTQTYRTDSDIHLFYGWIRPKTSKEISKESSKIPKPSQEILPLLQENTGSFRNTNFAAGKTALAAWFVSNCKAPSRRLEYAWELRKHIDIDIFGHCGTLHCKSGCDKMLNNKYKFYFSFENNICRDYVTEKLWNALKLNIVPVVLGGFDYHKYLPPHSYIDVRDFKSPKELAAYLQLLDKSDHLYNEYFTWKQHYVIEDAYYKKSMCALCRYLHTHEGEVQWYKRIDVWWGKETNCLNEDQYWKGHADFIRPLKPITLIIMVIVCLIATLIFCCFHKNLRKNIIQYYNISYDI